MALNIIRMRSVDSVKYDWYLTLKKNIHCKLQVLVWEWSAYWFGFCSVEGLALIVGIDRFMSEARALTNLIGNGIATIVVGHWCGQVDKKQLREILMHTLS